MSMILSTLYRKGTFYKGNTHCHSVYSDGILNPEDLKKAYQRKGYQFLLFSDHNVNTDFRTLNDEDFLSLQGFEGNLIVPMTTPPHKEFHLIFMKTPDRDLGDKTFQPYAHLQHARFFCLISDINAYQCNRQYNKAVAQCCGAAFLRCAFLRKPLIPELMPTNFCIFGNGLRNSGADNRERAFHGGFR